jgi:hypothetical protein
MMGFAALYPSYALLAVVPSPLVGEGRRWWTQAHL